MTKTDSDLLAGESLADNFGLLGQDHVDVRLGVTGSNLVRRTCRG